MKKYQYCFNDSKEPIAEGYTKEVSRLLKDVRKHNKGNYDYVHIYENKNNEYVHIETKCLNHMLMCSEAFNNIEIKTTPF